MPLFESRAVAAVLVGLLVALAVVVAADAVVQWSNDAAFEEFLSANTSQASEPDHSKQSSAVPQPENGRTGCPVGKRELPTKLIPLR